MLKKKKMKATIRKSCHSVWSEVWVSVSSPCDLFIIVSTKPLSYPPCWNCEPQTGTWTHEAWTQTWPKSMVFWLRSHSWFQDLMKLRFLMSHGRKNSVRGKVIGKKQIYLDRDTLHRQSKVHLRRWELASRYFRLVFYGLGMNGRINLTISGKGRGFPGTGPLPTFFFDGCPQNCHGTDGRVI